MGDVGLAVQRAEDKTAQMQARAGAIDELIASGALEDHLSLGGGGDDIDRELAALSSGSDVEAELARLKAASAPGAVTAGEAPKAIDATGPAQTDQVAQPETEEQA
jgi:phage shock protein A